MDDKIIQKQKIAEILQSASFSPLFQRNPLYCINQFAAQTPYISFKDILNKKIIIRGSSVGSKIDSSFMTGLIIMEYENIDKLVEDGWYLETHL